MLEYHAAFYREESGGLFVTLLDFAGVNSQGKNLREARLMIKDALALMAECYLEEGRALPTPNPRAKDSSAELQEAIGLVVKVKAVAKR